MDIHLSFAASSVQHVRVYDDQYKKAIAELIKYSHDECGSYICLLSCWIVLWEYELTSSLIKVEKGS